MDVDRADDRRLAAAGPQRVGVNLGHPSGGGDGDAHTHPQGISENEASGAVVGVPYRRTVHFVDARVMSAHTSSEMSPLPMACLKRRRPSRERARSASQAAVCREHRDCG